MYIWVAEKEACILTIRNVAARTTAFIFTSRSIGTGIESGVRRWGKERGREKERARRGGEGMRGSKEESNRIRCNEMYHLKMQVSCSLTLDSKVVGICEIFLGQSRPLLGDLSYLLNTITCQHLEPEHKHG